MFSKSKKDIGEAWGFWGRNACFMAVLLCFGARLVMIGLKFASPGIEKDVVMLLGGCALSLNFFCSARSWSQLARCNNSADNLEAQPKTS
ncbi:hypothetical protein [Alicyclobacillus shizuokensis]|uniref:hypothetical protein n=1 Tax=Alicyclobacillus shizuokensis TaxID=392014 RepID=UPI0012EEDCDB|nr:hypothetical protein [Alicyclobacillus shizuokensis]